MHYVNVTFHGRRNGSVLPLGTTNLIVEIEGFDGAEPISKCAVHRALEAAGYEFTHVVYWRPTARPNRLVSTYERADELVASILKMWEINNRLPAGSNDAINANIQAVMTEHDLTIDDWHYWANHAITVRNGFAL